MTNRKVSVAYVDHTLLTLLPKHLHDSDPVFADWRAANTLWRRFREEELRLVTHGKDTEMDIILWLNRQGCCITDTLRAMEAIGEFEAWNMIEKSHIQQYKQMLLHFEELELLRLPGRNTEGDTARNEVISLLKFNLAEPDHRDESNEDRALLVECLANLGNWYTEDRWSDLKRTDYQLNWQILESVLARHGIGPHFYGEEGNRNRYLSGLLNRAVGLTKKSCGKLPVPSSHIDFVIGMVFQKYSHDQILSGINHVLHCVRYHIKHYITMNYHIIEGVSQNRASLQGYLQIESLDLELMSPERFVSEVLDAGERG